MEYTTAFTAGPLMPKRSARIVEELNRGMPPEEIDPSIFDINSWQGQRRKVAEIKRRLESADESVWEDMPKLPTPERALILYYCCLKTYPLIFDFHMEAVLPTWRSADRSFGPHDTERFLEQQAESHPEIEGWGKSTWKKVRQVMLQMLREAGFLHQGHLRQVDRPERFWTRFVKVGDLWYLEAAFLNEAKRRSTTQSLRS
ncbi:BrxA family protein [Salinibacter altiplanensis]|uniref:BrxA family protein n=1 Tax=Salinibacter altiplanensis TaxID=1803181 RepID=UPI000C9ED110|nr:BrxA family protein [Salinibacter altiplanensis]